LRINSKIYPADFNKPFGTLGLKLPMNALTSDNVAGVFNMSYTTEEQAVSNYVNLLMTKSGERYMQPNFGVGLWYYIFESNTASQRIMLKNDIELQSDRWLPYITNYDIQVNNGEDVGDQGHGLNIKIEFSVTEYGANRTMTLFTGAERSLNIEIT
tara:strand:+ start:3745 stop:4212 length:468 start_codon:yes stop_codon:yes gene_type:complete